jgi:chromosome segregation ATPase
MNIEPKFCDFVAKTLDGAGLSAAGQLVRDLDASLQWSMEIGIDLSEIVSDLFVHLANRDAEIAGLKRVIESDGHCIAALRQEISELEMDMDEYESDAMVMEHKLDVYYKHIEDLRTKNTVLEQSLQEIDDLLASRVSVNDVPDRLKKILHVLQTASQADGLRAELKVTQEKLDYAEKREIVLEGRIQTMDQNLVAARAAAEGATYR